MKEYLRNYNSCSNGKTHLALFTSRPELNQQTSYSKCYAFPQHQRCRSVSPNTKNRVLVAPWKAPWLCVLTNNKLNLYAELRWIFSYQSKSYYLYQPCTCYTYIWIFPSLVCARIITETITYIHPCLCKRDRWINYLRKHKKITYTAK